jgi:hypothetical protein
MVNQALFRIITFCGFCFLLFSLSANAQEKKSQAFTLSDGQFEMRATYKFSDQNAPVVDLGGTGTVKIKGKELSIVVPVINQPIVMKLTDGIFKGKLQSEGANIEFQCEIVENNHTEGVFFGSFGQRKVMGIWTMKLTKKQSNQEKGT